MAELAFVIRVKDDGSAVVERFGANVQKTGKQVGRTAGTMTRAFGAVRGGISRTLGSVFNLRNAIIGLGAVAVIRTVVKSFADFETQMNRVRVLTGATGTDFSSLTDLALELGRTTAFSAKQSADAMGFLAMAGFEVDEVIGALPRTLELAAAAQLELGDAADIVTNILTGLQIPLEDLGKANDVLVKAFTSTNTNLQQLGQAFKFVGPIATSAGLQFEEVTAVLGLLGNAGIQASMAGTTLRGSIAKLLNPSAEAVKVLERLGVTAVDSSGKLVPFSDVIEQLGKGGATTADIFKIFGQRAGPGVAVLLSQGSAAIRELTKELEGAGGAAKEAAEVQLEGLNGALIKMKSAVEGAAISIGEQLAPFIAKGADGIREFAAGVVLVVKAIVEATEGTKGFGEGLRAFLPAISTLVSVFFIAARTIEILKIAFKSLEIVVLGLAFAVAIVVRRFDLLDDITIKMADLAEEIGNVGSNFQDLVDAEESALRKLARFQKETAERQAKQNSELVVSQKLVKELEFFRAKAFKLERREFKNLTNEQSILRQFEAVRNAAILEERLGITGVQTVEEKLRTFRTNAAIKKAGEEFKFAEQIKLFNRNALAAVEELARRRKLTVEEARKAIILPKITVEFDLEKVVAKSLKAFDRTQKRLVQFALDTGDTSEKAIQRIAQISEEGAKAIIKTLEKVDEATQKQIVKDLARVKGAEDQKKAFVQQRVTDEIQLERSARFQASQQLLSGLAALAESEGNKLFRVSKALRIGEAIVNTFAGANAVLADTSLIGRPGLRFALAAAVIAQGLANVNSIRRAKPGGGGGGGGAAGGGGGGGGGGAPGVAAMPAEAAPTGGLMEVSISVAGFVGDEAQLASEIGRVLREAEGDGVQVNVAT